MRVGGRREKARRGRDQGLQGIPTDLRPGGKRRPLRPTKNPESRCREGTGSGSIRHRVRIRERRVQQRFRYVAMTPLAESMRRQVQQKDGMKPERVGRQAKERRESPQLFHKVGGSGAVLPDR